MRENDSVKERLQKKVGLDQLWAEGEGISRLTPSGMLMQAVRMTAASVRASPFTAVMTQVTMVFALFMFGAFLLFIENVNRSLVGTQSEVSMSVYLRDSVSEAQRTGLEDLFKNAAIVRGLQYTDKTQALASFRDAVGKDSPLIEGIEGSNPLPASYELTFRSVDDLEAQIESLAETLRGNPIIEHVEYSRGMMSAIISALRTAQFVGSCAIVVMLILSGFIMMVAIRLALYAHRDEIEIMYLVGATRTFIRSPYMIEGIAQGLGGAILSVVLLLFVFSPLKRNITGQVASLIVADPQFLSIASILMVMALGVLVGVLGSYAAVRRVSTVTIGDR